MKRLTSPIIKRSIVINGFKTSVSLEDRYWDSLKHIAHSQNKPLNKYVAKINRDRIIAGEANLSSALRLHVLDWALQTAGLNIPTEMTHG